MIKKPCLFYRYDFSLFLRPISPKTKNLNKSYDFFPLWAHCAGAAPEATLSKSLRRNAVLGYFFNHHQRACRVSLSIVSAVHAFWAPATHIHNQQASNNKQQFFNQLFTFFELPVFITRASRSSFLIVRWWNPPSGRKRCG